MPKKLIYNLTMSMRFPWEMTKQYELFLQLRNHGVEANTALYVALNFELSPTAESVIGPFTVIYPMSALEATDLSAAGRFICARPGTLRSDEELSNPNVFPLWNTEKDKEQSAAALDKLLANDGKLSLEEILSTVSECVERQKGMW